LIHESVFVGPAAVCHQRRTKTLTNFSAATRDGVWVYGGLVMAVKDLLPAFNNDLQDIFELIPKGVKVNAD
jgi:hypothetical protein